MANFAQELRLLLAVIPHKILEWSIAGKTTIVLRNITFAMTKNRSDSFVITFLIVRDKILPIPFLFIGDDFWELINLKLLILW